MKRPDKAAILSKATGKIISERLYLQPRLRCTDVAKAIGTNRTYLWSSLRSKGCGFQEYLSMFRIIHFIKNASGYRNHPSREVAELCGFNDPKQLNHYLKKNLGVTLPEYMNWVEQGLYDL